MKAGLSLNQSLRLQQTLQPRQILLNELLTLPLLDLQVKLQEELVENICLESEDRLDSIESSSAPAAAPTMTPPGGDVEPGGGEDFAQDPGRLSELMNYLKESKTSVASTGGDIPEALDFEARMSAPADWRYTLAEQLRLERTGDDVARAAEYIVESLDDRGYLVEKLEDIAPYLGVSLDVVQDALDIVQRVAPPGVAARDLRERLLLCAKALPERNETLERILNRGFDDLLNGRFEVLRRKLNLDDDELREALELLKEVAKESLTVEDTEPVAAVTPDASIVNTDEGWKVQLHDESIPRLRLSSYAASLMRNSENLKPEAREYLARAMNRAKWMMEALEQRRNTLRRIIEAVVSRQVNYFDYGPDAMVPLRQEDIAEELGLHASTVSRAVQEKYVETPHGVHPLKFFFPRGVPSSGGGQQARNHVQDRLAALVAAENSEEPLSDDVLVEMLSDEGIRLSRRTVCKYRDELGIPPASKRKGIRRAMKVGPR